MRLQKFSNISIVKNEYYDPTHLKQEKANTCSLTTAIITIATFCKNNNLKLLNEIIYPQKVFFL